MHISWSVKRLAAFKGMRVISFLRTAKRLISCIDVVFSDFCEYQTIHHCFPTFLHRENPKIFLIARVTPTYENAYGPEKVATGNTISLRLHY